MSIVDWDEYWQRIDVESPAFVAGCQRLTAILRSDPVARAPR